MSAPFFVLSSGRSGSRTSARTLDGYRNCTCLHHPEPELVEEATQYFYGELPGERIVDVLRRTRPIGPANDVYGEVNLQHTLIVPLVLEVFPDARFVWLTRDGRDVVASMYYRGWYAPPDQTGVPLYWQRARLQGDRTGDFTSEQWQQMDRFAKCCWLWSKYNTLIEDQLQQLDASRWLRVRLDQFRASLPQLEQLLNLTGGEDVRIQRHNEASQPVAYWADWDAERRRMFEKFAGQQMDHLFPEWRDAQGRWQPIVYEQPDKPPAWERCKYWVNKGAQQARQKAGSAKRAFRRHLLHAKR